MQTIRRLYVYAVCLVSLEVVLWGTIGLLRSLFAGQEIGGGSVNQLAGALALILVGTPVFILHWLWAQRSIKSDPDERSSRVRAIFLYLALLVTLVPVTQNLLSLVDHLLLRLLGLSATRAMLGGSQSWSDNLVAILANAIAAGYFYWVVQTDWRAGVTGDTFAETRRLYRYIWLVYAALMAVFGLQQLLQFILLIGETLGGGVQSMLANGLALVLVGTPIWVYTGRLIQSSLTDPAESESLLRLIVLYILVFFSLTGCLIAVGTALYQTLRVILGMPATLFGFMGLVAGPVSIALSLGLVWAYYARSLGAELKSSPVEDNQVEKVTQEENEPVVRQEGQRRAGLRRLYFYVLSLPGLIASFVGLQLLFASLLELLFGGSGLGSAPARNQLAAAIAALATGTPVWILAWRPMVSEAAWEGEAGDHARRSLVRKSYLYLILFAGVLGVMISAGVLIYQLLRALLGESVPDLALVALQQLKTLLLFAALFTYHWMALRGDGRLAERSLARRYAQFPVLILAPEENDFSELIAKTLQDQAPGLPIAIHPANQGAPDASLSPARAVILPADLAIRPSEALRLWLQAFSGERLVLPLVTKGWNWIIGGQVSPAAIARRTAQAVRRLAEGQTAAPAREGLGWMTAVYIFAGLFALQLILMMVALAVSFFIR